MGFLSSYWIYILIAIAILAVALIVLLLIFQDDEHSVNNTKESSKKNKKNKTSRIASDDKNNNSMDSRIGKQQFYKKDESYKLKKDYERLRGQSNPVHSSSLGLQSQKLLTHNRVSLATCYTPEQELMNDYNRAVIRQEASEFKQKYRNRLRIGVQNTEERLKNPDAKPIFIDHDAGNYWGIDIGGRLLVVPRLELTFIETHNNPGGMKYVFKYAGFNASMKYTGITVVEPAVFENMGTCYNLIQQGRLNLGQGIER